MIANPSFDFRNSTLESDWPAAALALSPSSGITITDALGFCRFLAAAISLAAPPAAAPAAPRAERASGCGHTEFPVGTEDTDDRAT